MALVFLVTTTSDLASFRKYRVCWAVCSDWGMADMTARRRNDVNDPRQTSSHPIYPFAKRKAVSCAAFSGPFGNRVDRPVGNPIVTQTPRSTTCASFILSPLFVATAFGQS
jgi:hypothetical protein